MQVWYLAVHCPYYYIASHFTRSSSFIAGGSKVSEMDMKMCVLAEQCVEGSFNFGVTKSVITSKCCTSELCNSQPAPGNLDVFCDVS